MKKVLLLVALGTFILQTAVAQQFRFGFGGGIMNQDAQRDQTFFLTVSPGIYLPVSKRVSFSLDLPLKAGYTGGAFAPYSYDGEPYHLNASGYAFNIPLMMNFNFGAGAVRGKKDTIGAARWSTINREEGFGFFLGMGLASHYSVQKTSYTTFSSDATIVDVHNTYYYQSTGIMFNAGIRIGVGPHKQHSFECRFFYMKGTTNEKPEIRGLSLAYVL